MSKYYKGNYYDDYRNEYVEHRGWLVGEFMECFRKTSAVEIKFWKFKKNEKVEHEKKLQSKAIECTFILKGRIKGEIDGKEIVLSGGDYVIIPSLVINNFPKKILEDVEGLTIKAPSNTTDKITEKMFK
jgi:mannose-6-phosphate isomerase-like protein (cupin superfamily)